MAGEKRTGMNCWVPPNSAAMACATVGEASSAMRVRMFMPLPP